MFKYSSIYINLLGLFITIIIFIITQFFFSNYQSITKKSSLKAGFKVENIVNEVIGIEKQENVEKTEEKEITEKQEKSKWYLEIPKINLKADIEEGTTKEIMENYIGHFEETSKDIGNVGLAAHNRGYKNNYFKNLKTLKEGDSIFYTYQGITKEYLVTEHVIIKDTDWSYLENTEENIITLITCVENEPEYRRCIQGKEKNESEGNLWKKIN